MGQGFQHLGESCCQDEYVVGDEILLRIVITFSAETGYALSPFVLDGKFELFCQSKCCTSGTLWRVDDDVGKRGKDRLEGD